MAACSCKSFNKWKFATMYCAGFGQLQLFWTPERCQWSEYRQYFQQAVFACYVKALYYAGICSYATSIILCPKLGWHNSPRPSSTTRFIGWNGTPKVIMDFAYEYTYQSHDYFISLHSFVCSIWPWKYRNWRPQWFPTWSNTRFPRRSTGLWDYS